MSITLTIIGLLIGGVLVGQDLVRASEVRAQISQVEKFNTATNTFRGKFNAFPGDMRPEIASQFGFTVGTYCSGNAAGYRNGDGILQASPGTTLSQGAGENALFWQDLSSPASGNLIDGQFPNGGISSFVCGFATPVSGTGVGHVLPAAKIGRASYLYAYSINSANWFGLSAATSINSSNGMTSSPNLSVAQTLSIDLKIDDGAPTTGTVQALYVTYSGGNLLSNAPNTSTSGGTSSSCYDTTTSTYSVTVNNGSGANCALSFRMQGGG